MDALFDALPSLLGGGWSWFASLTREEWIIVLAVGCAAGFFCMRGFGSRANY